MQQLLTLPCSYPFTGNIGTGESYGPELEVTAKVNRYVTLAVSGTHTTAKVTSIDVAVPISDDWKATGRLSVATTGPFYDIDYYVQQLPGYTLADLRLGLAGGSWAGYLYINNHSWTGAAPATQQATVNQPRTVGLQVNFRH